MQKHIQHNKDERTQFFRKIYLSFYWKGSKGLRMVLLCEMWVGDWTELQHIDSLSSDYNSISFPFFWAAQPGAWGSSLYWDIVLIPASSLQLIRTSCAPSYIIVLRPLNSNSRQSRVSPDILDRMHLLFTQVHFSFDSLAGSEVNIQ